MGAPKKWCRRPRRPVRIGPPFSELLSLLNSYLHPPLPHPVAASRFSIFHFPFSISKPPFSIFYFPFSIFFNIYKYIHQLSNITNFSSRFSCISWPIIAVWSLLARGSVLRTPSETSPNLTKLHRTARNLTKPYQTAPKS